MTRVPLLVGLLSLGSPTLYEQHLSYVASFFRYIFLASESIEVIDDSTTKHLGLNKILHILSFQSM
jgi:hypothetical protein